MRPFAEQLREARAAKGVTFEELAFRTQTAARRRGMRKGLSRDAIAQLAGKPARRPREESVLLLGEALGARFGEFPAYDLARAREMLDEHAVGDKALENLVRVSGALGLGPSALPGEDEETLRLAAGRRSRPAARSKTGN